MLFTKMHGCGNDYIYVDGSKEKIEDRSELARVLSDRHFGIGGDGVIFINPSDNADFEMEMYNADGSRGRMCGNGIRCVAKFVFDKGLTDKNPLTIESFGSVKTLYLTVEDGEVKKVRVDMGEPVPDEDLIDALVDVKGKTVSITSVSMGNPHAVIYVDDPYSLDLEKTGPEYEHLSIFPEGVNTEFIKVIDRNTIKMRVWERGSGETLACGTGACASVVASVINKYTDRRVRVRLRGGDLDIEWNEDDNHVYMTGPAETVFEGEIDWDKLRKGRK